MIIEEIIAELEAEQDRLDTAITALGRIRRGRPRGSRTKRTVSAEARRKMSISQNKRRATRKRASKTT